MALESTLAIVLKSFPYGDTSKIARCYTRDFGKLSIIAKGIKTSKTLQSGYLEPMNCLSLNFYYNPKRQLQIFSKAEFSQPLLSLKHDVKKLSYGFAVVELVDRTVTGEEPHADLFHFTEDVLEAMDKSEGHLNRLFWFFEIKLLSLLGFRPHLSKCPHCQGSMESAFFSLGYGELLCGNCSAGTGMQLSQQSVAVLKALKNGSLDNVGDISFGAGERREVGGFLQQYFSFHIEGLSEVRSLRVMESILA